MCACMLYYCNVVRWVWWDWELSISPSFSAIGWRSYLYEYHLQNDLYCALVSSGVLILTDSILKPPWSDRRVEFKTTSRFMAMGPLLTSQIITDHSLSQMWSISAAEYALDDMCTIGHWSFMVVVWHQVIHFWWRYVQKKNNFYIFVSNDLDLYHLDLKFSPLISLVIPLITHCALSVH